MKVVLTRHGGHIAPLGARAADLHVLDAPLVEVLAREFAAGGHTLVDALDARGGIVVADHTWVTAAALRRFVEACPPGGGRMAIGGPLWDLVRPLQGVDDGSVPIWRVPDGDVTADRLAALPRVLVDLGLVTRDVPVEHPVFAGAAGPPVPIGDAMVVPIRHWVHLHRANLLALVALADGERRRIEAAPPWTKLALLAGLVWRARSLSRVALGRAVNRFGADVNVHPTAVVEGCVVGDGVEVGAHAVVRGAFLAPGAKVSEQARVVGSVVGRRATIAHGASLALCVVQPGAWVSRGVGHQACVFGAGSFVAEGVTTFDLSFGGEIHVRDGDARVSVGTRFLGACVGRDARVGPHVRLGYGEEVPAGAFLVADPDAVARRIPATVEPGPLFAKGGVLVPIRRRDG